MKIFLDANVLVTVLCNEYPRFSVCARVLSLCDNSRFEVFTSPLCLAIGYYFSEKKNGNKKALEKIMLLGSKLKTSAMDEKVVRLACNDKSVKDFEDGLQYYSALNAGCKCIVTYDKTDFWFSGIEVLNPEEFLLKHVVK